MSTSHTPRTRRLARRRLALVSAGAAQLIRVGSIAAALLLAAGVLAIGWAALRPIGSGASSSSASPPLVRVPTPPASAASPQTIAQLRSENPFAPGQRSFAERHAAVAENTPATEATDAPPATPVQPRPGSTARSSSGEVLVLQELNSVPDNVRMAFLNLHLNAIYQHPESGQWMAMLVYNNAKDNDRAFLVAEGSEFTDPSYAQAPWRIRRVDIARSRVIVSRSESTLALELYQSTAPRAMALREAASDEEPVILIEHRTLDEVAAEMRAEGFSESEIQAILADLVQVARFGPDAPAARPATPEAINRVASEAEARQGGREIETDEAGQPVFGMAELLRMMATGRSPIELQEEADRLRREQEAEPEPAPAPESK